MPITKELNNIRKLEAVGFPHEQAEALTDIIEQSHIDSQQGLKEFIHSEIVNLEFRQRARICASIKKCLPCFLRGYEESLSMSTGSPL